jgi:phage host-nuclease inhibitor protein Gam
MDSVSAPLATLLAVDGAMSRLLAATLRRERLTTERDEELARVVKRYAHPLQKASDEIGKLEAQIQQFYTANQESLESDGKKSLQLTNGVMGMRSASNPALIPLSDKWNWEQIAAAVKRRWKLKYFHKPKPPALDKVKIKAELDAADLVKCGLALDTSETFYYELNRLVDPDRKYVEAA